MSENQHGGARPGAGRKPTGNIQVTVRLTPKQALVFKSLGGSKWLQKTLDTLKLKKH